MPSSLFADVARDRLTVEFFPPPQALQPCVTGFNVYGTFTAAPGAKEHFFPGWATIRFNYSPVPFRVRYRGEDVQDVPPVVLFGPSSNQVELTLVPDAVSLGFGISPLGLQRLLGVEASHIANRMVPGEQIWPDAFSIHAELARQPDCASAFARLGEVLTARLGPRTHDTRIVADLLALLVDNHDISVAQVSRQLGYSEPVLRRIALRHFGFPIKLLLRRSRFLKSLMAIYGTEPGRWSQLLDPSYHDQSHFIRDSHLFLGITPTEFLREERPMTDMSVRKRMAAMGAPFLALHKITR